MSEETDLLELRFCMGYHDFQVSEPSDLCVVFSTKTPMQQGIGSFVVAA